MITRNTVLVLGAGASHPYGLPVGEGLRRLILDLDDKTLRERYIAVNEIQVDRRVEEFRIAFRRSQFYSIDAFLGHRPEFAELGKHAIACTLLPSESPSNLLDADPSDHWYRYLLSSMDATWEDFGKNRVAFITFNSDRSLELFLEQTIAHRFGKSSEEARGKVSQFPIVHVYGSFGSLDPKANDYVPYGGGPVYQSYLYRAAKGLEVIPEGRDDSAGFGRARALLEAADALCFLGFGFDRTNVRRLGGNAISAAGRVSPVKYGYVPFAATALGLTERERESIAKEIANDSFWREAMANLFDKRSLDVLRHSQILQ